MSASDEVAALMREIKKEFNKSLSLLNLALLDNVDFAIPEDISHIQNLHDIVVQDLESLRKSLDNHASVIEKTELIMNILNYKLYEIQYQFRSQFDKLKEKKESLIKISQADLENPTVALKIVEIDDEISTIEESHQKNLECIKEQKLDAQKAYERAVHAMDQNFEKMTDGLNKLLILIEAEKSTLSDSQAKLIDSKFAMEIAEFRADIERFTELQTTGWKIIYPEERISEILHQRGLKVLQSGQLITDEGQQMTYKQAKASKLFEALSPSNLKELKANLDYTSESSFSTASIDSRLSSEDVHYLKTNLGRPLTQAIAEISTVQPRDPVHYLGHWLFKYRYNQQMEDVKNIENELLNEKRVKIAKERWHKFIEEEAREAVIDMIVKAEEIAMLHDLARIQEEEEDAEENEGLDEEARDILGQYTGPSTGQRAL